MPEAINSLFARIRGLQATRERLGRLAGGQLVPLPADVVAHLADLESWGFSQRWVDLQRDLWILVFATHPDQAPVLFGDQRESLAEPALRRLFLDYDAAYDLAADDPRIDDLARRIGAATRERYGPGGELPQLDAASQIPGSSRARSATRPRRGEGSTR
ncbi:MerR family transcriptional regulator [Streptomyces sp. NPDC047315]|uniref:MerR family transcriptional regulator n=1 Tax=Streptomyces sp. NPDC047315 TaxID=3155142 RepID=UPI0033FBE9D6